LGGLVNVKKYVLGFVQLTQTFAYPSPKLDSDGSRQKCEIWSRFSANSKQAAEK